MTTAFAHACNLRPDLAFLIQPGGAAIAILTAAAFWIALHVAIFGSRIHDPFAKLLRPKALWIAAGAWGASWGYTLVTWSMR